MRRLSGGPHAQATSRTGPPAAPISVARGAPPLRRALHRSHLGAPSAALRAAPRPGSPRRGSVAPRPRLRRARRSAWRARGGSGCFPARQCALIACTTGRARQSRAARRSTLARGAGCTRPAAGWAPRRTAPAPLGRSERSGAALRSSSREQEIKDQRGQASATPALRAARRSREQRCGSARRRQSAVLRRRKPRLLPRVPGELS
jgi:hypothetical protein